MTSVLSLPLKGLAPPPSPLRIGLYTAKLCVTVGGINSQTPRWVGGGAAILALFVLGERQARECYGTS